MLNFGDPALPERFWNKVTISPSGCWEWQGFRAQGYGRIRMSNPRRGALTHRVAYAALVGEIPSGLDLDHLCRNRACCNPSHLEPVTRQENLLRGNTIVARLAAKTHCPQGHPYSGDNLVIRGRGSRVCRTCQQEKERSRPPRPYVRHPRQVPDACPKGHPYTPENMLRSANEGLRCRTCRQEHQKQSNAAMRLRILDPAWPKCSDPGCGEPVRAKSLCLKHYMRARRATPKPA